MASVQPAQPIVENAKDNDVVQRPKDITRDQRFRHIVESQIGRNGIYLLVSQSILFIFALIIIVAVMIGSLLTNWQNAKTPPATNLMVL